MSETSAHKSVATGVERLTEFCQQYPRLVVLTGAGCSTASGIPDYRDQNGDWKHPRPVQFGDFVRDARVRQRYWARSTIGWTRISAARPNAAHRALAQLEQRGRIVTLITQNVDGLHQRAGSRRVIDLHGRLDQIRCLGCDSQTPRSDFQAELRATNPHWSARGAAAPDGDVHLREQDYQDFQVPNCRHCGGILKPDVVFFGENVPPERVRRAMHALTNADGLLIVGSSLMVFSGFRFAREAHRQRLPVAAINQGRTRADSLLDLKLRADCCAALPHLAMHLPAR